jgi:hypothetical protein
MVLLILKSEPIGISSYSYDSVTTNWVHAAVSNGIGPQETISTCEQRIEFSFHQL